MTDRPRVLALSGSLRADSSNLTVLRAFGRWSAETLDFALGSGVGALPHFNPDLDTDAPPSEVLAFRATIARADAVLIACPEYAHGVPGSFKNALDWLVSEPGFVGTPVALINASAESTHADRQLREILATMNACLLVDASFSLPLGVRRLGETALLADDRVTALFARALPPLFAAAKSRRAERALA
ncbi:MAG: NAD(P)H-dependent oxidoreductase [Nibricoccus sp.]